MGAVTDVWYRSCVVWCLWIFVSGLVLVGCESERLQNHDAAAVPVVPASLVGTIRIALYGEVGEGEGRGSVVHEMAWMKGPSYQAMSDNDIRGFLDGRFKHGWNQPLQIHVRVGRRQRGSSQGEFELFRVLHHWGGIRLPAEAEVHDAALEIDIEQGVDRPVELLAYTVYKDWNPGEGGVSRNNNSRPAPGELWWNSPRYGAMTWSLPGAGLPGRNATGADTPIEALAQARYQPDTETLEFSSQQLASYVQQQAERQEPVRLMVKLSDYLEDSGGIRLGLYSAEHGDSRNTSRRPRLRLTWSANSEVLALEHPIVLEHGRTMVFGPFPADKANIAAISFAPESVAAVSPVRIDARIWQYEMPGPWLDASLPLEFDGDRIEVRLSGLINPTPLGTAFVAEFRDTWVTAGPPESQRVLWTFIGPSGRKVQALANYVGDNRWRIDFTPDEVGRWRYYWSQNFIDAPYTSALGQFDVVIEDTQQAVKGLQALIENIQNSYLKKGDERVEAFGPQFYRLQRALVNLEQPNGLPWRADDPESGQVLESLDEVREALGGALAPPNRLLED